MTRMRVRATGRATWRAWLLGGWLVAGPAAAHMPYVLPSVFDASGRSGVTVEASFTEDAFRPEIAMQDAPFEITDPAGRTTRLAPPVLAKDATLADAPLPADGVYRISSGQRLGRMGKMYRAGGHWIVVGEGTAVPPGATLADVRSTTLADAYVVRGKPGASGALAPRGKALELHPLGDPTGYAPGAPAAFELLYDGRPVAGEEVTLFRETGFYDGRKQAAAVRTDAAGRVSLTPPDAGRYLILARHRPDAAAPGQPMMSYTVTVAFEAM